MSDEVRCARSFRGARQGRASASAHRSVGAKGKRGRESGKQKRKCVNESREGERCFIDGTAEGQTSKSGDCGASPIGAPQRATKPEGAGGDRSQAGGRGGRNNRQMGAVSRAPLAVV
ncbi:hypothetical protein N7524_012074 [Penicillium chrysogenum]|nr:hypothetical protein N7524_012074 [Penicillium chrysogenum]